MGTADDIRAACTGGQVAGGPYDEGGPGRVSVYRKDGALYWTAGMTIDCDGQPGSACNSGTDPYFQPQTAFTQSDGRPLKADQLPYVVVPLASSRWDYRNSGVRGGDLCVIAYRDKHVFGVVGDLGPSGRIGEASYAAAAALGINPNPRSGGVGSGVTYVVFPGVRVSPIESKEAAERIGREKLAGWLGTGTGGIGEESPVGAIDKMIAAAEADIGLGEPNYIQDWYDQQFGDLGYNWAWCNAAVTWWAHKSGNAKAVCFSDRGHFAYTVAHAQAFKDRGQWTYGTTGIKRGDVVFFDWQGQDSISAIDHVGLVVDVKADGIHTIEGNIEDAVRRKVRGAYEIAGYGRPAYADTPGAPPAPGGPGPIGGTVKLSDAQAHTPGATRVIQTALNREFGGVVVDGDFGPQTEAAYTRWQRSLGWPGDGQPGADSLTKLGAKYGFAVVLDAGGPAAPPPAPAPAPKVMLYLPELKPGLKNESVHNLQWMLKAEVGLDFSSGPAVFGPQTQEAYAQWQRSLGYSGADADGVPGQASIVALCEKYGFGVDFAPRPGTSTPAPPPADPGKPLAGKTVTAEQVYVGAPVSDSVRVVQDALNREFGGVVVDGDFGPKTKAAYSKWQLKLWPGASTAPGGDADGNPAPQSLAKLGEKYGFAVKSAPGAGPAGEPAHNYSRTSWSGKTINQRTKDMLNTAQALAGFGFTVSQGSYNAGGVAASAGTHDGGGAVDIAAANLSGTARTALVTALRKAGFAAWLRTPAEGPWGYHIHAVAIGDRELSSGAARQVQAYFNGRNALANDKADTHPGGRPYPAWAGKYDQ